MDYCQLDLYQLTQYQACQGQLDKQMMISEQYANPAVEVSRAVNVGLGRASAAAPGTGLTAATVGVNLCQCTVTGRGSYDPAAVPSNILEAEQALRLFDCSASWGTSSSATRFERLARRRKFFPPPPGLEWVDDILHRFPALGHLKAFERYRWNTGTAAASVPSSVLTSSSTNMEQLPKVQIPEEVSASREATLEAQVTPASTVWLLQPQLAPGVEDHTQHFSNNRTLQNVEKTCFFNSVLQVVALIHPFAAEIARTPLLPDFAEDSYCLVFL